MAKRQNTFLIKRSNVPGKVPSPGDLQLGELALNTADVILYASGTTSNQILPIGWDRLSILSGGTVNGNVNINGSISATTYLNLPSFSGDYLPLSGGTVYGETFFTSGITSNAIYTDYIDFNTTPTVPSPTGGTLYFDSNENALSYKPITNQNDVTVNLGQESLIRIYNDLPTTILNGQVLHITGATSGVPTVALANASNLGVVFTDSLAQSSGVATHDIPSGEYGFMTNFGVVRDLNTTAFTVGQEVFLSDTIDGGLTNDPNNIAFTSRISTVGYCLESNATTGKILVVITNENPLQSLTQQEVNVLLGNTISTGAYFYTGATTASTTTINVSPMRGWIVYNTGPTYATNPLVLNIYYSGGTNLPVSGLTSSFDTYLLVNSGGTLYQTNTYPTPQERRQNIFLGRVVHPNKTTILNVEQSVDYDVSPLSSLRDLWVPIKIINEGVVPSPNGANLTFKTSSGTFWGNGIGFPTDELNPNAITVPGYLPASFYYTTQTGGTFTVTTTTVDTTKYDVNGVAVNVPGSGSYTTQRIYMSQSGVIRLQYGQNYYSTLAKAIAAIPSETFVVNPDNSIDCTLIGLLTVKDGTGDLSNTDDAVFTFVSKFGEILGGTAGISTTTLQQAYNNSVNPEIITNSILGGVQFRGGTGIDSDSNIIIENNSGVVTGKWLSNGYLSATTLYSSGNVNVGGNIIVTGGTGINWFSSNTSTDLVRITQTGSGNALFIEDSTNPDSSPFVVDSSGNVGIGITGTTVPLYVRSNAIPSTNENILRLDVSDAIGSYLDIRNGSTTDGQFISEIVGNQSSTSNLTAIIQGGYINSTQDTGTNPVTIFRSALSSLTPVSTRPLFDFRNWSASTMLIAASGYIGMGTTTPSTKLHLIDDTGLRIGRTGAASQYIDINQNIVNTGIPAITSYSDPTNAKTLYIGATTTTGNTTPTAGTVGIQFNTLGSGAMFIDSSQRVNIGTGLPTAKLTVVTTETPAYPTNSGTTQTGYFTRFRNGGSNLVLDMGGNTSNGNWLQSTNQTDLSLTYPLLLNPNGGNVGIGILLPTEKLHVAGNALITGTTFTGNLIVTGGTGINWISGSTSTDMLRITQTGNGNALVVEDSTNPDSSPFVVDAAGNVGIGTTTPSYLLDVKNEQILGILSGDTKVISKFSGRIGGTGGTNSNNFRIISTRLEDYSSNDWSRTGLRLEASIDDNAIANSWIEFRKPTFSSINNQIAFGESSGSSGQWMIIDNGNVGINTTTPSEKLQISGNTIVSGTISGGTMVITTQPTSGYTATQILMRNSTTGQVEITDSTSPSIYNYGMTYAMSTFNYLT
jgi:hypothetical protein